MSIKPKTPQIPPPAPCKVATAAYSVPRRNAQIRRAMLLAESHGYTLESDWFDPNAPIVGRKVAGGSMFTVYSGGTFTRTALSFGGALLAGAVAAEVARIFTGRAVDSEPVTLAGIPVPIPKLEG